MRKMFRKIRDYFTLRKIERIKGLGGMTVNERLYVSGLLKEFDYCLVNDRERAKTILKWIKVDQASINKIVK